MLRAGSTRPRSATGSPLEAGSGNDKSLEFLSPHARHQPRIDLIRRHVCRYPGGVPGPAHGGVLRPDPYLLAEFHVAEIHVLIGENDDDPFLDIHDDLLPGLDGGARPLFELA